MNAVFDIVVGESISTRVANTCATLRGNMQLISAARRHGSCSTIDYETLPKAPP